MTATTTTFETSFGMFAACDLQTYKKLKRINHYLHQIAQPWARRWERAQKRLPKNRIFRIRKHRITCDDSFLFAPFYVKGTEQIKVWNTETYKYDLVERQCLKETQLLLDFRADMLNARTPVKMAEEITPMIISEQQIDDLLLQIREWADPEANLPESFDAGGLA